MHRDRLTQERAAVLVVDLQEKLCGALSSDWADRVTRRTAALVRGAQALGLPIAVTEQYPKGLGSTVEPLRALLVGRPRFEKRIFSAALPEVLEVLSGRDQILVAGLEAHVCVFQTARDLSDRGRRAFICADAVASRTELDRGIGLSLCREADAAITTVEAALFELLGRAEGDAFKAISEAVK